MCCSCFFQLTTLYLLIIFHLDLPLPYVDYLLASPCRFFWTISELSLGGQARSQHLHSPSRIPRLSSVRVQVGAGHSGLLTLGLWLYLCDQALDFGLPDPMAVWPEPWYSWEPCSSGKMEVLADFIMLWKDWLPGILMYSFMYTFILLTNIYYKSQGMETA